jgi:hypothetical protein
LRRLQWQLALMATSRCTNRARTAALRTRGRQHLLHHSLVAESSNARFARVRTVPELLAATRTCANVSGRNWHRCTVCRHCRRAPVYTRSTAGVLHIARLADGSRDAHPCRVHAEPCGRVHQRHDTVSDGWSCSTMQSCQRQNEAEHCMLRLQQDCSFKPRVMLQGSAATRKREGLHMRCTLTPFLPALLTTSQHDPCQPFSQHQITHNKHFTIVKKATLLPCPATQQTPRCNAMHTNFTVRLAVSGGSRCRWTAVLWHNRSHRDPCSRGNSFIPLASVSACCSTFEPFTEYRSPSHRAWDHVTAACGPVRAPRSGHVLALQRHSQSF